VTAYIVRRLFATLPVMAVVALFVFFLLRFAPGDPAAIIAGEDATSEAIAAVRAKLGLDQPLVEQFVVWLWALLQGDMGVSIFSNLPVTRLMAQQFRNEWAKKEYKKGKVYRPKTINHALIGLAQLDGGQINTAFIERLNATFRARLPSLVRRTRSLAASCQRLEAEMFWSGAVYNFCTVHTSVHGTPAMAAGLTDHVWSFEDILVFGSPLRKLPVRW
jgi:hypothetical protein